MNKKTCLLLLAVCLLTQVHTQTVELDARGSWIFWPYKLAPNGTVESTLKFVNAGSAARYADSSFFAPVYNSSGSSSPYITSMADIPDADYIKGAVIVFAWNYLQYNPLDKGDVPDYENNIDLIRYEDFYTSIKAIVNLENIKAYGIEIWTGQWSPIGIANDPNQVGPYWLSNTQSGVKRLRTGTGNDARYYPDYLDKGRKPAGQGYINNSQGTYPDYVEILDTDPLVNEFIQATYTTTAGVVYDNEDYTSFGYMSDNLAETKYEYWYRKFLYKIIQYLCNLKTTGDLRPWEDIQTNINIKQKLLFLQIPEGTTGDLRPWDGIAKIVEGSEPNVQIDLDDDIDQETEWPIFVRKHWGWLANTLFALNGSAIAADPSTKPLPNVRLLLNGGSGSKVWGKKAADNNPGISNLPRTVNVDFTKASAESYFLWPASNVAPYNDGVYNNNADRLTRNWFGKRSADGTNWGNTPNSIMKYLHQSWRKPPEGGHLYNMNFGKNYRDIYRKLKYDQLPGNIAKSTMGSNGGTIRYRDECDWNNTDLGYYTDYKVGGFYDIEILRQRPRHLFATATSALDFGIDYWIQYINMVTYKEPGNPTPIIDAENGKVYTFFNQHVQDYDYSDNVTTNTPMSSYLAFKDGLDGNDYARFAAEDAVIGGGSNSGTNSSVDNDGEDPLLQVESFGEAYCKKIAENRKKLNTDIYNQNSMQAVWDIAQGGAGNQYNRNGAGKNDVGWFVNTDNDGAIIKKDANTNKLTMQEVSNAGTTSYKAAQVGYYNIIGKTTLNSLEIIDKSSMFGRFSKGVVSPNMAGNTNGLFYQKAGTVYIKFGDELRSNIYNNNSTRDVYIAITWFGSMEYNGGSVNDATTHKLRLTIQSNDCTLKTFPYDFNRYITSSNPTDRKRWYTTVYKVTNWFVFPAVQPWDFAISNISESADVSIQLGMVEVFVGSKPDYMTDNSTQTKSYYTSALTSSTGTNPFADANITLADVTPPPQNNCNWLIGGGGDSAKANTTSSGWQLYPNPATNHTSIKMNKACKSVTITLQDITGKILHTQSAGATNAGQVIAINKLPAVKGTYIVMLQADGERSYKKLVVE